MFPCAGSERGDSGGLIAMMIVDEEHREIVVECREQHVDLKRTQLNNRKEVGRARNMVIHLLNGATKGTRRGTSRR